MVFRVKFDVEFPRQVVNFPIEFVLKSMANLP